MIARTAGVDLAVASAMAMVLAGCWPFDSFTSDCEGAFKYRLKAPSTYKRIDSSVFSTQLSVDEYAKRESDLIPVHIDDLRQNPKDTREWTTLVTYEASNIFGVPVRGRFYCKEITTTGKEPSGGRGETIKRLIMEVNGISGLKYFNQNSE